MNTIQQIKKILQWIDDLENEKIEDEFYSKEFLIFSEEISIKQLEFLCWVTNNLLKQLQVTDYRVIPAFEANTIKSYSITKDPEIMKIKRKIHEY